MNKQIATCAALAFLVSPCAFAQDASPSEESVNEVLGQAEFSPYAGRNFPSRALWGDQHTHTAVSVDAGTMSTLGQEDAYRFALGEEIITTTGVRAKLARPLDWLVIADRAEMYGMMPQLLSGDPAILATEAGRRWYEMLNSGDKEQVFAAAMEIVGALQQPDPPFESTKAVRNAWRAYTALADEFNDPGRFTALIGYEYTTRGGFNLHRNVIFRDGASIVNQMLPFSQFDSQNPEDLWKVLDAFQKSPTGGDVLASPHNGNLDRIQTIKG